MKKIYIRTVRGRKYRYERVSAKRKGKKVVTQDRCLGPVNPVKTVPIMGRLSSLEAQKIINGYVNGGNIVLLLARIKIYTGADLSQATLYQWLKNRVSPAKKRLRTENARRRRAETRERKTKQRKI